MTQDQLFEIELDEFDFSNGLYDKLTEMGVRTIGDLAARTGADLGCSSSSSYVCDIELITKLGKHGIRLRKKRPELDEVKAIMLGHAIADALGVPVEFKSREELAKSPVEGYMGYGSHHVPAGTWSDDTSMTLAALDSLTHGLDYADMMQRFCDWKTKAAYTATDVVFDMGITTNNALCRFLSGVELEKCGDAGEYDNGNGSLMRITPAVLYCNGLFLDTTTDEKMQIVHKVSSLTHAHPRSQIGCGIYAFVLSELLSSKNKTAIRSGLRKAELYYQGKGEFADELVHFSRLFNRAFSKTSQTEILSSGYVVSTLEAAIWCVLNTESYSECVLSAVNLGQDTDTVAAVAGGLAAAIYGLPGIPAEWIHDLQRKEMIFELCERFVDAQRNAPNLVYDESRIAINAAMEQQYQAQQRIRHIHEFAERMLFRFQYEKTREEDVASHDVFGAICFAFGFSPDLNSLGNQFRSAFGRDKLALRSAHAFSRAAYEIHDPDTLGSVIFAKWRYETHWAEASLLSDRNRAWFITAFERLKEITDEQPACRKPFHYLVDVHGHYVYGVDDGAVSLEMSMAMIRKAYDQGVRDIVCSSHSWGYLQKYKQHLMKLQQQVKEEDLDLCLYPATEIACSERSLSVIIDQLIDGRLLPIGKSSYVLIEFDRNVKGIEILRCIKQLSELTDYAVIIAHAERYTALYDDEQTMNVLKAWNVLMQINAFSLVEEKDVSIKSFARKLLAEKLVTFIGSDAHRTSHRAPNVLSGLDFIYKNCTVEYADEICYKNAEELLIKQV